MPEHRNAVVELHGKHLFVQVVFQDRADHWSSHIWPKGEGSSSLVFERVHLFRDDVTSSLKTPLEQLCIFKRWGLDAPVGKPSEDIDGGFHDLLMQSGG